jgi:hypothetical protein
LQRQSPGEPKIVPGATYLFEGPGKLEEVARLAADWFQRRLRADRWKLIAQAAALTKGRDGFYETPFVVDRGFVCGCDGQFKLRHPLDCANQACQPAATCRG